MHGPVVPAGEVSTPPEQVHIAPPAPRHSSRPLDPRRLAGLPADGPSPPAAALDLPASLEYSSGCQRSHCRVLAAPVRQPFSVASAARELPSGGVAVQFTLTSNLAVPAQLARLALQPQPGFALSSSLLDSIGLLPASLGPGESLTAAFLLVPESDAGGAASGDPAVVLPAKLQPSVLSVDYTIDSRQQCGVAAAALGQHAAGAHHSSHQQQAQHNREAEGGGAATDPASLQQQHAQQGQMQQRTPGSEALDLLGRSVRRGASRALGLHGDESHPAAGGDDSGSDGEGQGVPSGEPGGRQLCSFRHLVTLEMHASEEGSSGERAGRSLLGSALLALVAVACAAHSVGSGGPGRASAATPPSLGAPLLQARSCLCACWAHSPPRWGSPPRSAGAWSVGASQTLSCRPAVCHSRCRQR